MSLPSYSKKNASEPDPLTKKDEPDFSSQYGYIYDMEEEFAENESLDILLFDLACEKVVEYPHPGDHENVEISYIETLLLTALQVYAFNKNRHMLKEFTGKIAQYATTLPKKILRSSLKINCSEIDDLLIFTDIWDEPLWKNILSVEAQKKFMPELSKLTSKDEKKDKDLNMEEDHSVPYLAFLLAMTDFQFSDSELKEITSGRGMKIQDIKNKYKDKFKKKTKIITHDRGGACK